MLNVSRLDEIYTRYGYEIKKISEQIRVYVLRQGMYYGAEVIPLSGCADVTAVCTDFSNSGYLCQVRNYLHEEEAEERLFAGFFNAAFTTQKIRKKYEDFTEKHSRRVGVSGEYKYITSPYSTDQKYPGIDGKDIVKDVVNLLGQQGAQFIIIEAAAGFGKTCTVYEIVHKIIEQFPNKTPLFTELARNRQARIFKYVLLSEIEEEFHGMISSDLVAYQIATGRIPLIIDGFDELLSKDLSRSKNAALDFEQVETMLSTIGELLKSNAKIILTSRKTAIFSGKEFNNWAESFANHFKLVRFNIENPQIPDWLDFEKQELLLNSKIPIRHICNPVLLTYFRHVSLKTFQGLLTNPDRIISTYFNHLLVREKERQNLLMEPEMQLEIFRKLAVLFAELNITSEDRTFVKELLIEYHQDKFNQCRQLYPAASRPTLDELAETLTNHALLDRVGSKGSNIGFINEFILGVLLGEAVCSKNATLSPESLPENIAELAVTAFQFMSKDKREKLWQIFTKSSYNFSRQFKLIMDIKLKDTISGAFDSEMLEHVVFEGISFSKGSEFIRTVFKECRFYNCNFDLNQFLDCSFINCSFLECQVVALPGKNYTESVLTIGCNDYESGFLEQFDLHSSTESTALVSDQNKKILILAKFFMVDGKTTRRHQLSLLETEFENSLSKDEFYKLIHHLTNAGYLTMDGSYAFLNQEGITYYHHQTNKK